jgi:hypothetical protein
MKYVRLTVEFPRNRTVKRTLQIVGSGSIATDDVELYTERRTFIFTDDETEELNALIETFKTGYVLTSNLHCETITVFDLTPSDISEMHARQSNQSHRPAHNFH